MKKHIRKYFATLDKRLALRREGQQTGGQSMMCAAKNYIADNWKDSGFKRDSRKIRVYLWRALAPENLFAVDVVATNVTASRQKRQIVAIGFTNAI